MKKKQFNALLKASKIAQKEEKIDSKKAKKEGRQYYNPSIAGAYFINGNTYITNSYWAIIKKGEIEGLVMASEGNGPDINKIIKPFITKSKPKPLFNIVLFEGVSYLETKGFYFPKTQYDLLVDCLDNPEIRISDNCLIFINREDIGIVMAMRSNFMKK